MKYIDTEKIMESEEKFIFRKICHSKKDFRLKGLDKLISYSTVRVTRLLELGNTRLDKTNFGLHSLRSRGATAAANLEVNEGSFQKHARWRSEM